MVTQVYFLVPLVKSDTTESLVNIAVFNVSLRKGRVNVSINLEWSSDEGFTTETNAEVTLSMSLI